MAGGATRRSRASTTVAQSPRTMTTRTSRRATLIRYAPLRLIWNGPPLIWYAPSPNTIGQLHALPNVVRPSLIWCTLP
eukprot:3932897-Prymnesium_polylepis.1